MVQDPTIPGGIGRLQTWPPEPIPCTPDMTTDPVMAFGEKIMERAFIGDTPVHLVIRISLIQLLVFNQVLKII